MSQVNGTHHQKGLALLGTMVLVLILSLLGATLLNLAGHEVISANVGREAVISQELAEAAGELVVAWFHNPQAKTVPSALSSVLSKKNRSAEGRPSFFDQTGRSQFVGTVGQPDIHLRVGSPADDRTLNDPETGSFRALRHLGVIEELKIYAPSNPGLLCTVDATVATQSNPPFRQSVLMQLAALDLPPLQAAVQVFRNLGVFQAGGESPVAVHWGDLKVGEDLVLSRSEEIPMKTTLAPIMGQGYATASQREDRWADIWVGGQVHVMQPSVGQVGTPTLPDNVHPGQSPIPGVQFDRWTYEHLKHVAIRHGTYFAIDKDGLLYPQGRVEPGHGISPDEVFQSQAPGDHRGLIFIDTLDQTAPRTDNLGVLRLRTTYLEGLVVMQGHVVFAPSGAGQLISVLSPPVTERDSATSRASVQLTGVHLNGVLSAAGNITVAGQARVYGAVAAGGTIASVGSGDTLEVWYDHDLSQGLYRGLPVVYRAPGTWLVRY